MFVMLKMCSYCSYKNGVIYPKNGVIIKLELYLSQMHTSDLYEVVISQICGTEG